MRYLTVILFLLAFALSGHTASAQPFPRGNGAEEMQPLNTILGNIRSQYPGQLSDVEGPRNGRYLIKWLTPEGQVLELDVDARSGRVLGVRGGGNFRRQNFGPAPAFLPQRQPAQRRFEPGPHDRTDRRSYRWNR